MVIHEKALDKVKDQLEDAYIAGDIDGSERVVSVIAGTLALAHGIQNMMRRPIGALGTLGLAAALFTRAATGKCIIKGLVEKKSKKPKLMVIEHRYFIK